MFLMPVVQMILLGYVATTSIEHLRTAVLDRDRTLQSRELIDAYRVSNYFDIAYYVDDEPGLLRLLDSGDARAGMIIPVGYGQRVAGGQSTQIAFLIDGLRPQRLQRGPGRRSDSGTGSVGESDTAEAGS
jgi:ABC-2 type transport system permease protein